VRNAYSYTRLSTKEQLKGDGARRQIEDRDRWLAAHPDAVLNTEFALVETKSAFRGDHARTGRLSLFLRAIEDGRIPRGSVLLLESYDRLSREQLMDSVYLLLGILRAGIDVVTFGSGPHEFRHDATGADQMMALMYSMMVLARANEESEIKSHRGAAVWDTRRKKARTSLTVFRAGNKPPWLDFDNEKSVWIVNKQRAKVVKRIAASFWCHLRGLENPRWCCSTIRWPHSLSLQPCAGSRSRRAPSHFSYRPHRPP
jgi:DNA invertase Pin-like site-specific DNA recombinase